jgi:hypothetical protein
LECFYEFWEHFLTLKENVEDATEEDSYYILIKQIPEPLRKRVVEHQTKVLAERNRLSLSGLPKMTMPVLKDWLAKLHIIPQHVKILPDQVILDVKGEYPQQQILALQGCRVGDEHGPVVTVKMLPKPKHLDAEEVVAKVKECLQIQEHSKELGGAVRNPDPTTRSNWQRHTRLVDTSDDGDSDDDVCVCEKLRKFPP